MTRSTKVWRICFALVVGTTASTGHARNMPHAELVKRYLQGTQYKQVLNGCKTVPFSAPAAGAGQELECWAAKVASDLEKEPVAVTSLVLNDAAREAALLRCRALSMEQRSKSAECAAVGYADAFISLRLPRAVDTLKPVTFK